MQGGVQKSLVSRVIESKHTASVGNKTFLNKLKIAKDHNLDPNCGDIEGDVHLIVFAEF